MLCNNLDPECGEKPDELIVYGGTGGPPGIGIASTLLSVPSWKVEKDETLLVQSGKPVGILRTHAWSPRVLHRELESRAPLG